MVPVDMCLAYVTSPSIQLWFLIHQSAHLM